MQNPNPNPNDTSSSVGSSFKDDLAALKTESSSARETLHDARDEVQRKAGEYASEAKAAAIEQAEGAQKSIGETIASLGGAMRAASDHLAQGQQNTMSKLMNDAAGGVERFSDSLKNKKFDEILDDVRQLGRENSGALFAGSILAGLALGRFVKSSAAPTHGPSSPRTAGKSSPPRTSAGRGEKAGFADPSRSSDDSGEPTVSSDRSLRPPSRQSEAASSKTNIFGEGSGEKLP